ncbi:hypothetical protein [Oecophyllibacter saccharovorans]|uniref:hypothetical protein n=1 Tax=Oecophyllibacter saccharovorans TaxID=2558360 RepID=UPI00117310E9|nr:hypothetical protein [Oecophyllibacter saccharovorans]TPW36509.1 hypothetical protein E3203_01700 [Oecophyllibacter saccharovorans]
MNLPFVYFGCFLVSLLTGWWDPKFTPLLEVVNVVCLGGVIISGLIILYITRPRRKNRTPTR